MIITIACVLISWAILMIIVGDPQTSFDVYFNKFMVLVIFGSVGAIIFDLAT